MRQQLQRAHGPMHPHVVDLAVELAQRWLVILVARGVASVTSAQAMGQAGTLGVALGLPHAQACAQPSQFAPLQPPSGGGGGGGGGGGRAGSPLARVRPVGRLRGRWGRRRGRWRGRKGQRARRARRARRRVTRRWQAAAAAGGVAGGATGAQGAMQVGAGAVADAGAGVFAHNKTGCRRRSSRRVGAGVDVVVGVGIGMGEV